MYERREQESSLQYAIAQFRRSGRSSPLAKGRPRELSRPHRSASEPCFQMGSASEPCLRSPLRRSAPTTLETQLQSNQIGLSHETGLSRGRGARLQAQPTPHRRGASRACRGLRRARHMVDLRVGKQVMPCSAVLGALKPWRRCRLTPLVLQLAHPHHGGAQGHEKHRSRQFRCVGAINNTLPSGAHARRMRDGENESLDGCSNRLQRRRTSRCHTTV